MAGSLTRRPLKALTAQFVRSAHAPGKYFDGHGLYLRVEANKTSFWVQRIVVRGKRTELGLGSSLLVSLADARAAALENRRVARQGGDPLAEKRRSKAVLSFEQAARKTHIELSPTWKNKKERSSFLSTLEAYVFPRFGSLPVSEVTSADIRQAILAVRAFAPEVARKLVFRISAVFKWAMAEGMRTDNPARGDALALPRVEVITKHRKALPYDGVKACIDAVKASGAGPTTKLALELLVLTASRSGEIRLAEWSEIDLAAKVWEVPAERMKMKRMHRVPLSPRAVAVLTEAQNFSDGSPLVFPGTKHGKALSDMTLSKLVKELGFDADVHGFRTSFRTWAQDLTDYPREVAEAALAHLTGDAVERAYARSDVFDKRKKMMDDWASYIAVNHSSR